MSYTTFEHLPKQDAEPIAASSRTLRSLPGVPASFRIAALMLLRAKKGQIRFRLPTGRLLVFNHGIEGPRAEVIVHNYDFARRAMAGGDIGFAESYMDGQWSTPDLTSVLRFFAVNFEAAGQLAVGGKLVRALNKVRHAFNRNSKNGSRRNIEAHYDLGNEFYEAWLDPSMTYSSALYLDEDQTLEQAQHSKYERIAETLRLQPDQHVLEIGCGWGGFAEHAAKERQARVTCLTISPSQRAYALERIQKAGLSERVEIRLEDYRDHRGRYDGVASIEMFEAVGESYWPSYFAKVHESLKPNARAALQIITIDNEIFHSYRKRADFIQRYIFPGGMLPSENALREQCDRAGLSLEDTHYFREDYAETLRKWANRFEAQWPRIQSLGFDDRFKRLWMFYLSYCEAGFIQGRIDVGQFALARTS